MAKQVQTLKDLKQDGHNANKGTDRGGRLLRDSLADVGPWRSIGVDANGIIGVGNKTGKTWRELAKPEDVIVVQTDGTKLVVVQRTDLDLEAEDEAARKKARRAAYYDNRAAELNLEWEIDVIREDWREGVGLGAMWEATDLFTEGEIMGEQASGFLATFVQPPAAPAPGAQPGSTAPGAMVTPIAPVTPATGNVLGADGDARSNYTILTLATSLKERDYVMATLQNIVAEQELDNVASALVWLCEEHNGDHAA